MATFTQFSISSFKARPQLNLPKRRVLPPEHLPMRHLVRNDIFQYSQPQIPPVQSGLKFGAGNFKQLVKEFKKLDPAKVDDKDQAKKAEDVALKLFKICPTEKELIDFAKQTGIIIHHVEESSPIGQWMKDSGAQGFAVYPKSKIPGLPQEALGHFSKRTENGTGFELLSECEQKQKPLILILDTSQNTDFMLYVLKHELFHIIQNTVGNYGLTPSNYLNESLASGWHTNLLKTLRNKNSDAAKDVKQRAEKNKKYTPQESGDTFGQALRQITSLDLETYQFFCKNAERIGLSPMLKEHNENLKDIYQTIKLYSYSPDLNTGLSSIEMRRS